MLLLLVDVRPVWNRTDNGRDTTLERVERPTLESLG